VVEVDIRVEPFDGPDAQKLIALVQEEYIDRYGGVDETLLDPAEFTAPKGSFLVGYVGTLPAACGGWRLLEHAPGTGEIKRMYVVPEHRRTGLARVLLAALEDAMRQAGCTRVWLETGERQPEALALYRSSGYEPIDGYGHYKDAPLARPMGKTL
jgi:GNAT superfamily N-acetyltransferase